MKSKSAIAVAQDPNCWPTELISLPTSTADFIALNAVVAAAMRVNGSMV
jgi:hypothetical protein